MEVKLENKFNYDQLLKLSVMYFCEGIEKNEYLLTKDSNKKNLVEIT